MKIEKPIGVSFSYTYPVEEVGSIVTGEKVMIQGVGVDKATFVFRDKIEEYECGKLVSVQPVNAL